MITCKPSDYLTISLIPDKDNNIELADFLSLFLDTMFLSDMLSSMLFMCSNFRYEQILRFEDIQIKIPYEVNYKTQGICLELSGNGLNYYEEWLKKYNSNLRSVCRRFYSLVKKGFKPKCSRFDVAFDEKAMNSAEKIYLDLNEVQTCLYERRFVSSFRKSDAEHISADVFSCLDDIKNDDDVLPCDMISSLNLSNGRVGKTIQLGKRGSNSVLRFYDKKAEQEVKGFDVPDNVSSWVRCELEVKKTNANSIFMKFVELSEKDFVKFCSGYILSLIRFITLDRSRRYNCSVCDWWSGFFNHAKRAKLTHYKPHYNKFLRAVIHQRKQNAPSLKMIMRLAPKFFKSIFSDSVDVSKSKSAMAIKSDYEALKKLSPEEYQQELDYNSNPLTGIEFLRLFWDKSDEEFDVFVSDLEGEVA